MRELIWPMILLFIAFYTGHVLGIWNAEQAPESERRHVVHNPGIIRECRDNARMKGTPECLSLSQ